VAVLEGDTSAATAMALRNAQAKASRLQQNINNAKKAVDRLTGVPFSAHCKLNMISRETNWGENILLTRYQACAKQSPALVP
jgi:hypothetical protein